MKWKKVRQGVWAGSPDTLTKIFIRVIGSIGRKPLYEVEISKATVIENDITTLAEAKRAAEEELTAN